MAKLNFSPAVPADRVPQAIYNTSMYIFYVFPYVIISLTQLLMDQRFTEKFRLLQLLLHIKESIIKFFTRKYFYMQNFSAFSKLIEKNFLL